MVRQKTAINNNTDILLPPYENEIGENQSNKANVICAICSKECNRCVLLVQLREESSDIVVRKTGDSNDACGF